MAHGSHRMNENHPRTNVTHHLSYTFLLNRGIAMDVAFPAAPLRRAFRTALKPIDSIRQQIFAIAAKTPATMMLTAVDCNHLPDDQLFPVNSIHKDNE